MRYDAITLDTDIFHQNGYALESGLLGQLKQFKRGSVKLVISEIVCREVIKHISDTDKEEWIKLERALKKTKKRRLLSDKSSEQIEVILSKEPSHEDAAKIRLNKFIDDTGAEVIPAIGADMNELIKLYFLPSPPFEQSKDKKSEFPDAIALLSLDKWALSNNKKILTVSYDNGWKEYANNSSQIEIERDLAKALQKLQIHVKQAEIFVAYLLDDLSSGAHENILQEIIDCIGDGVSSIDADIDADAPCQFDVVQVDLSYEDFEFLKSDKKYNFSIVQIGANQIVVKVMVTIKVKAEAEVSFFVWDSIDRDQVSLGGNTVERETEFDAAVLIAINKDFSDDDSEIEISDIEFVDLNQIIDIGYIDMCYEDEDPTFEKY